MKQLKWIVYSSVIAALALAGCNSSESNGSNAAANDEGIGDDDDGRATTGAGPSDNTVGDTSATDPGDGTDANGGETDDDDRPMPPVWFDVGGGQMGTGGSFTTLDGFVWAPNGEIPVSGALVYTTHVVPEGIPQEVYCAECADLDPTAHFAVSNPDGSFELPTVSAEDVYLVVRKGEFMRVSVIDIDGSETLDASLTTLPDHNDPDDGQYIPLIAVADGQFDRIEDALGKFGLGDTMVSGFEERLVPGTESFDLYDNGRNPTTDGFASEGGFDTLFSNPELLAQYHIIFIPCSGDAFFNNLTPTDIQNIRDWVAAGGRWYVADWANEFIVDVFPEYQTFHGEPGSTDLGVYNSLADILDTGLLEWLEAIPDALKDINPLNDEAHPTLFQLPQVETVDNWSGIETINPVVVQDKEGNDVDVGYKTWLEGPGGGGISGAATVPLTVTGQFGCGKIQFTSYHTAEFFDYVGLSPQELVLIYTILEIGVCQDPLPPPVPEG
ncbi:MAG: hypothetical protein JKY37_23670 [Nannocystaceae bacterium]|nr:hypothetical protein [Nannocystaceae bacterium]